MIVYFLYVLCTIWPLGLVQAATYNTTYTFSDVSAPAFPPRSALTPMPSNYQGFTWSGVYAGRVKSANCMITQSLADGYMALPQPNATNPISTITPHQFYGGCFTGSPLRQANCFIHIMGYNRAGNVVADDVFTYLVASDSGSSTTPGQLFNFTSDFQKIAAFDISPLQDPLGGTTYAFMTGITSTVYTVATKSSKGST